MVYTQKYNMARGCDGTLSRGRFKSILVDADSYVLQLVRYIHWSDSDSLASLELLIALASPSDDFKAAT